MFWASSYVTRARIGAILVKPLRVVNGCEILKVASNFAFTNPIRRI
jgi:hypothetical protein